MTSKSWIVVVLRAKSCSSVKETKNVRYSVSYMACEYLPSEYATLSNFPSGTWSRDNAKGGEAEDASIHTGMARKLPIHPLIIRSNITNSSPAEFLYTIRREMSRHDMALVAVPWVQLVLLPILMLILLLSPAEWLHHSNCIFFFFGYTHRCAWHVQNWIQALMMTFEDDSAVVGGSVSLGWSWVSFSNW